MKKQIQPILTLSKEDRRVFPLVGWHNPWANFTTNSGEEWQVKIVGGCQYIWLRRKDGPWFSIDITEVVQEMMKHVPEGSDDEER